MQALAEGGAGSPDAPAHLCVVYIFPEVCLIVENRKRAVFVLCGFSFVEFGNGSVGPCLGGPLTCVHCIGSIVLVVCGFLLVEVGMEPVDLCSPGDTPCPGGPTA